MHASTARLLSLDGRYHNPSGEAAGCEPRATTHSSRQPAASSMNCDPGRLASMISLC